MAHKRQHSTAQNVTSKLAKKPKIVPSLCGLPVEIVGLILAYTLPDSRKVEAAVDILSTAAMYTAPILQTCRSLRQHSLRIINERTVWIRIKIHDSRYSHICQSTLNSVPLMPPELHHLISSGAPKVSLEFCQDGPLRPREARPLNTDMYLIPANISSLIKLCTQFTTDNKDARASYHHWEKIIIKYENINNCSWREVKLFIVPAMIWMDGFQEVVFVPETASGCSDLNAGYFLNELWPLEEELYKAEDLLRRGATLEDAGYVEEARLLYLNSTSLLDRAEKILPKPADWEIGVLNHRPFLTEERGYDWTDPSGQCPKGNRFRTIIFELEQRACVAYCYFLDRYGDDWCKKHPWDGSSSEDFVEPLTRFYYEPECTWFGITNDQQVRLHLNRAKLLKAIAESKLPDFDYDHSLYDHDLEDPTFALGGNLLAEATIQMGIVAHLLPDSEEMRANYTSELNIMRPEIKRYIEQQCSLRSVTISYPLDKSGNNFGTWSGDAHMLASWGENDVLQYLPLAQKMPNVPDEEEITQFLEDRPHLASEELRQNLLDGSDTLWRVQYRDDLASGRI